MTALIWHRHLLLEPACAMPAHKFEMSSVVSWTTASMLRLPCLNAALPFKRSRPEIALPFPANDQALSPGQVAQLLHASSSYQAVLLHISLWLAKNRQTSTCPASHIELSPSLSYAYGIKSHRLSLMRCSPQLVDSICASEAQRSPWRCRRRAASARPRSCAGRRPARMRARAGSAPAPPPCGAR